MRLLLISLLVSGCSLSDSFDEARRPPAHILNDAEVDAAQPIVDATVDVAVVADVPVVSDIPIDVDGSDSEIFSINNCEEFGDQLKIAFDLHCDAVDFSTSDSEGYLGYLYTYFEYICREYYLEGEETSDVFFENLRDLEYESSEIGVFIRDALSGDVFYEYDEEGLEFNSMYELCENSDLRLDSDECYRSCGILNTCFKSDDSDSFIGDSDWCDGVCMLLDYPGQDFFRCINENFDSEGCGNGELSKNMRMNYCLSLIEEGDCNEIINELDLSTCNGDFCSSNCSNICNPIECNVSCASQQCVIEYSTDLECIYSSCLHDGECSSIIDQDDLRLCQNECTFDQCGIDLDDYPPCDSGYDCSDDCSDSNCEGNCLIKDYNENRDQRYDQMIKKSLTNECNKIHLYSYEVSPLHFEDCETPEFKDLLMKTIMQSEYSIGSDVFICQDQGDIHQICLDACEHSNLCDDINGNSEGLDGYFYENCPLLCLSGLYYQHIETFNCNHQNIDEDCNGECDSIYEEIFFNL